MKNQIPPVTSTYFVTLIKAYLQGSKTSREILNETADVLQLEESVPMEITYMLTEAAREINEDFYFNIVTNINHAPDTTPTRAGLIHHLEALIAGQISEQELLDWATWHNIDEDALTEGVFEDLVVEYFCLNFLPASTGQLSLKKYQKILQLFRLNVNNPLREKIALVLVHEQEKQRFLFHLRNYLEQSRSLETLELYLLKKFGMDRHSFPYITELQLMDNRPGQLEALLKKAEIV